MARLNTTDARRVRDLTAHLATFVDGGPSAMPGFVEPLRELLGTEKAIAYSLCEREDRLGIESFAGAGVPEARFGDAFDIWLRKQPVSFAFYNPSRPERWQRNVAISDEDLRRRGVLPPEGVAAIPMVRELWRPFDMHRCGQLRLLVCDGPSLLAWVGGLQPGPFVARQKRLLATLARPLQRRLRLERDVGAMARTRAALEVALEAIGRAAFVVGQSGNVRHANAAGRALIDGDRAAVIQALRDAAHRRPTEIALELTPIRLRGAPEGYLAIQRGSSRDERTARVGAASIRWGLSPRQREVLELLSRGLSNRTIAAALGVSERAVELHVSAIFDRAGVCSRAALAAELVWRD